MNYIPRKIEKRLFASLDSNVITMIIGSRQVGKSTLMQMAQEYVQKSKQTSENNGALNISSNTFSYVLDDIQLRGFLKKDIRYLQKDIELSLGASLETTDEKVFIFIDEVQKMPQLFDWVKQVFDQNSAHVKFILTGSSAIGITDAAAETLAGRVEYITIFPFVYSELLANKTKLDVSFIESFITEMDSYQGSMTSDSADDILSQLKAPVTESEPKAEKLKKFLDTYLPNLYGLLKPLTKEATATVIENLFFGGLPRIVTAPIDERARMIKNYISVYLEKEIGSVARNLDLELFGLSLQSFAQQNGETLNINQVSKEVGISRPSLYKYLDLLENTYLVKKVYPYLKRGEDQEETTKGIMTYYLDTGILNNLSYVTSIQEMVRPDVFNKIMGSWLLCSVLSHISTLDNVPPIYYWQDYAGHKVDIVFERGDFTVGFITQRAKDPRKQRATIEKFAESSNKQNVVIIFPFLDGNTMSLEYKVDTIEHDNKQVLTLDVPIQFLG